MILERLTQLAIRLGLDDSLVEPIRAHAAVRIDRHGNLLALEELPKRTWINLPREALRSSGIVPQISWDKPPYLLGHPSKTGSKTKLAKKRAASLDAHRILADLSGNPRLRAAAAFLERDPYPQLAGLADGNYVLFYERDKVAIGAQEFMRKPLEQVRLAGLNIVGRGICPITGEEDDLVSDLHAKIKPLPGSNSSGGSLVSFDSSSSWGWGAEGTHNMVIGKRAFFGYPTALRWLLSNQRIYLAEKTTAVWWTNREHLLERIVADILDGNEDKPFHAFEALQELEDLDDLQIDFAILTGAQGRGSVVWYRSLPARSVADALLDHAHRFFYGKDNLKIPSLRRILLSCSRPDQKRPLHNIRNPTAVALFRAAIGAGGEPIIVAHDAAAELDRRLGQDDEAALDPVRLRAMGHGLDIHNGVTRVNGHGLDIRRTEPPYVLGSLFAVMEEIQQRAIHSLRRNKRGGIAARWLREARRNPGRVFPVLQSLSRNHLDKLRKRRLPGYWWLDDVYLSIQGKIDEVPQRLTWEGQGLFMLGYDHTRAALRWRPAEMTTAA